ADMPAAPCSTHSETVRAPAVPLIRKLEIVAPVKTVLRNRLKSTSGWEAFSSALTNTPKASRKIANSAQVIRLVQPMLEPWVTTISSAARPTAIEMMPAQSVLPGRPASGADSGIWRISRIEATDTSAQITKIERQPRKVEAMKPPKMAVRPEPPQEPIDHIETARWRALPSQ